MKGKAAIDLLMKEKSGWVADAFYHKGIGNIALFWGDDTVGLKHIIKRRLETKQPLGKLLKGLTEVIENGILAEGDKGRILIKYKGKTAVVKLNLNKEKFTFLLTAYYDV